MSENTTHLSTAPKRKHAEEEAESIEKNEDKTTELLSAEKKAKFQKEKASLQTEINENQTALDNKLKTNVEIDDQKQGQSEKKDTLINVVNFSEKIPTNEQVPTDTATNEKNTPNNVEANESPSLDNNLEITELAKEATESEIRAKAQDKNHNALTKEIVTTEDANERTIAPTNVYREQCQSISLAGKIPLTAVNEEKTVNDMEKPNISIKANKLVKNYIDKNVLSEGNLISSRFKPKGYPPTQKLYAVLKEPKHSKPPEHILQRDEATKLMAQIKSTRILIPSSLSVTVKQCTDTNGNKNCVLPKKVIQPSVTIVPIEKKTKDLEGNSKTNNGGKNNIGIASNTKNIPKTNTISRMKVPKESNSSIYPTGLITKRMVVKNISGGTLATTKKAMVSTQQFTPASTATTSRKIIAINRNKLTPINYKARNCVLFPSPHNKPNAHDKPIITSVEYIPKSHLLSLESAADKSINSKLLSDEKANGIHINDFGMEDLTITADSISTAPKPKKLKLCDSASMPTLTPAYLKALSAYIEEAKKAHKAASIDPNSSTEENSINIDKSLENNPVTENSISKESTDLVLENESSKDGNSKAHADAVEQLDVKKSSQDESTKSMTDSDEQLDADKISKTESTKSNIDIDEQLDTASVAVEKEANTDSLENDDIRCKTVEITNYEEAEAEDGKEAEKKKTDANHGETEQCEERETRQLNALECKATKDATGCAERMDVTESNDIQCAADILEQLDNKNGEKNKSSEENITLKIVAESEIPQIKADATAKNRDEQCEIVVEENEDLLDCVEGNSEGIHVEKEYMNQNKPPHCSTDESEKMEMDESSGTKDKLKLATENKTPQIEAEVCEVVEKRKLDIVDDDDENENDEVEKQIMNQTNSGTNKVELNIGSENVSPQNEENKECKLVEEKNSNCDEIQSEGVDIENHCLEQNKTTQFDIAESGKMEVDESGNKQTVVDNSEDNSVTNDSQKNTVNNESIVLSENESTKDSYINSSSKDEDINFDTGKGAKQTGDETDKINLIQSSFAQYEYENKGISESYATQGKDGNNKLHLNANKSAKNASDGNNVGVSSQYEMEGTHTISDIGTVLNETVTSVFSTCVNSNKCNAFTQTNDSIINLLKNIYALRKKVRRQAEEIVSLNAAMKLLDTTSLLKTVDNC
ncbi:uncharacterized protein LOC101461431 [Ceratitis capitata]|uniref:uncharacterized protein LOC101461431 n=1 Tax=Ceratitis capitata TaxID=7213 RepID=UPI000329FE93|nr:uncharacterized protein LOC101461431 [Ceratitis capitata]